MSKILISGAGGFIGSNFVHYLMQNHDYDITVVDYLNYASNLKNLDPYFNDIKFFKTDISDVHLMEPIIEGQDYVINFAAETHVDNSIANNGQFVLSNVLGVDTIARLCIKYGVKKLVHVSTDEVMGDWNYERDSIEFPNGFTEKAPLNPRNPYSATKSSAELLLNAYTETFGLKCSITRGSNTYGPRQYPEKIIPKFIQEALAGNPLPVYGDGSALRDYLYVTDHVEAIYKVLVCGNTDKGDNVYNVATNKLLSGNTIANKILALTDYKSEIKYVEDRLGHDMCYNIDTTKINNLGWNPQISIEEGLERTIKWYETV